MKHTISALASNRPGVLADMALMFKRHNLNIRSLAAGETEDPDISRIVISLDGDSEEMERLTRELAAMDVVIQVDDLARREFVDRELLMVKVRMDRESLSQLMQIFEVFRASVVGMGQESITVEMAGDQERVEGLIKLLKPFGIKSLCRSGMIALKRGDD